MAPEGEFPTPRSSDPPGPAGPGTGEDRPMPNGPPGFGRCPTDHNACDFVYQSPDSVLGGCQPLILLAGECSRAVTVASPTFVYLGSGIAPSSAHPGVNALPEGTRPNPFLSSEIPTRSMTPSPS